VGNVYLTTKDDKLHIIKPNGEIYNVIQFPTPPFHQLSETGRSADLFIEPIVLPDGTIVVISEENTVYAMNSDGDILWEHNLESEPAEHPIVDERGNLYLIDDDAAVNAFDKNGFKWRFQSDAADIPANGIALGPEGTFYYVVTNYSKAFIQAVSNEGEQLWVVQSTTRDFYDELHISSDGKYVSLAENLVSTESGELVEYETGSTVDEFIFAGNGQNYFRSLHTVSEWQIGSSGIEILSSGIVSEEDTILRPPLASSADSHGIVWLYYPERYVGGGIIVVWMAPDGELLGNHLYDRNFQTIIAVDMERSFLRECIWFKESQSIDCNVYSPASENPVLSMTIKDITSYAGGFIDGDFLYIFGEENELFPIYLGEPTFP